MKMPGLCGMAVVLAFFLSIGNGWNFMDPKEQAKTIKFLIGRYGIDGQFSLAVSIPQDQDLNKLEELFKVDDSDKVKETILNGGVYEGTNVVAATYKDNDKLKITEHAEARVLDNMKSLNEHRTGKFLVFYSYFSPCGAKCTNPSHDFNILGKIKENMAKWNDNAFVFSRVFDKTTGGILIDKTEIVDALNQLKNSIGSFIFRCYTPKNLAFRCIQCYTPDANLLNECVKNEA